jgi:LacI family transcriptional regulator
MERGSKRKRFRDPAQPVKLSDVAALAGVSPATASRVLNTPEKVGADMREKVRAAAATLGYVPDAAARALASRRSRTIGAVVPTLDNPIFATGVQKLESRLNERGYALVVAGSDYRMDKELRQATNLLERGIEGLMLMGTEHHPSLYILLETRGVPHVNTWVDEGDAAHPCIGFDNVEAAVRLTNYLLDLGHERFAMVAGIAEGNDRAAARAVGVREALARRGRRLGDGRMIEEPYGVREGRDGLRAVLAGAPEDRPTAVICGNEQRSAGLRRNVRGAVDGPRRARRPLDRRLRRRRAVEPHPAGPDHDARALRRDGRARRRLPGQPHRRKARAAPHPGRGAPCGAGIDGTAAGLAQRNGYPVLRRIMRASRCHRVGLGL